MSAAAVLSLLDPPTLAQALRTAFVSAQQHDPRSDHTDLDAAAIRAAVEACEKTAALLKSRLELDASDSSDVLPPPVKRRAVSARAPEAGGGGSGGGGELGAASSAATSTFVSSAALANRSTGTSTTISSTKTIHIQQPDSTWATSVVPCESREIVVLLPSLPATLHDSVMQSDLKELVLSFFAMHEYVAIRTASLVLHEALMDTALDLWDMNESVCFDQLKALAWLTKVCKFKMVPARCACAAASALACLDLGAMMTETVQSHELLGLGLGRPWRLKGIQLAGRIRAEELTNIRAKEVTILLEDFISSGSLAKLSAYVQNEEEGGEEEEDEQGNPLNLSAISHFRLLTHLCLCGNVAGDASSLQNLIQLQHLDVVNTQVSGSLSFLQNLTQLQRLNLAVTQVSGSLSFLQNLTQLQSLDLNNTQVSGSLSFLENLTLLQSLDLRNTQVSGSLSFLQSLTQLQHLDLRNTQVSGSLPSLQNLTQLQILYLSATQVSGDVTSLPQLAGLEVLNVAQTQVSIPTQKQVTTFQQQHPECRLLSNTAWGTLQF